MVYNTHNIKSMVKSVSLKSTWYGSGIAFNVPISTQLYLSKSHEQKICDIIGNTIYYNIMISDNHNMSCISIKMYICIYSVHISTYLFNSFSK